MVADARFHLIVSEIAQQNGNFAAQSRPRVCVKATDSFRQSEGVCYAKLLQSRLTLCNPLDGNPPGSSVHGILQARILVWVAMPSSRGNS